jgi:HTH-like domain
MIRDQGLSVSVVCRDMRLGETALRRWLTQVDEEAVGHRLRQAPAACLISAQFKAEFVANEKICGSRRLVSALQDLGLRVGRSRERRLMREHRLRAQRRCKFIHTADSAHRPPVTENLLARRFDPSRPDRAWVSDITYIRRAADGCTCRHDGPARPQEHVRLAQRSRPARRSTCVTGSIRYCRGVRSLPCK